MKSNLIRGLIVLLAGAAIWNSPIPIGLKPQAWDLFAIFTATILAFILKRCRLAHLAFIAVTFTALSGTLKVSEALAGYSSGTI